MDAMGNFMPKFVTRIRTNMHKFSVKGFLSFGGGEWRMQMIWEK